MLEVENKKRKTSDPNDADTKIVENSNDTEQQTCGHWVPRKKRFCKMTVAKGRKYCCEHLCEEQIDLPSENRIPCPYDGKHTIYFKNVKKHLKVCNSRPKKELPPYIQKHINVGDAVELSEDCKNVKLHELTDEEFYQVIGKVKQVYTEYIEGKIDSLNESHNLLDDELSNAEYGKESKKHLVQAAAMLGILDKNALFQNSTTFIEFGAGKGQLSFYLAKLLENCENSQVVLIDRMSLRHKKDNKIENRDLVQRIRADIGDFCMEQLDLLRKSKHCVAVSKHLCGAATDLSLRCITRKPENGNTLESNAVTTDFIMIAVCCHHRCDWRTFVGKDFFTSENISPRTFTIITKMVSWAVCGGGMSRERRRLLEEKPNELKEKQDTQRLNKAEREEIGFMCKRILDYARVQYLNQNGYLASLKYYVARDITLENVCLIARKL